MRSFPLYPQSSDTTGWQGCDRLHQGLRSCSRFDRPHPRKRMIHDAAAARFRCEGSGPLARAIKPGDDSRSFGSPKRKTRPGGQPDGSSYMGAWGGWALAPNTASMGRDNRSHTYWSRKGGGTFKRPCVFLTFSPGDFGRKFIAQRRDWPRPRWICRMPWRELVGSRPCSRERHRGPEYF
jgi:hypothetical protein